MPIKPLIIQILLLAKLQQNKIVVDSTTETFNGAIAVAMNPRADTESQIEVPSYKIKVTGLISIALVKDNWAVGLIGNDD